MQREAWLSHCFAPSCIPLTPAPRCLSSPRAFTAAPLLWVFLVASKTFGRLCQVLFVVPEKCHQNCGGSDRCEGEGSASEGLKHAWAAQILELGTTGAARAGLHGKLQELKMHSS